MDLVDRGDLLSASNSGGFPVSGLSTLLMKAMKLNRVNQLYSENYSKKNLEFLEAVLQELEIRYELDEYELRHVPKEGAFVTVSNHPFGGVDGLLLLKVISMIRQDYKVFGNFLLQRIEPLQDYIIPVNPFDNRKNLTTSVSGIIQANRHLSSGRPLGMFPAGEVSAFNDRNIQDRQWMKPAVKFIKNAEVPVLPIYFHGQNSNLFYLLGMINPWLRTAKLPSELFNKKNKTLTIRIGAPISVEEQAGFSDIHQYGRFLRARTYALGSALEVKKFYNRRPKKESRKDEIARQGNMDFVKEEIRSLTADCLLITSGDYQVYCTSAHDIPYTLNEIGRLREVTFRDVGEGTNRSLDLDEYDLYYDHLFVWDRKKEQIAGAYRVGKGREIQNYFGKKGFYTNSLFHINDDFQHVLERSIELGRSFVVKEYQKKPACLFLLWKGILSFLLKHKEYRYLIGPVSISNSYSHFSKSLIIEFIKEHYFHHQYARLIRPRKKFKVDYRNVDHHIILEHARGDLNKLDQLIEEVEPSHFKMPVLFKKYLKQNARIIGFNVDPRFNEALDGLMLLDLFEVPYSTLKSLSKELNDASIMDRFYGQHHADEFAKVPQL